MIGIPEHIQSIFNKYCEHYCLDEQEGLIVCIKTAYMEMMIMKGENEQITANHSIPKTLKARFREYVKLHPGWNAAGTLRTIITNAVFHWDDIKGELRNIPLQYRNVLARDKTKLVMYISRGVIQTFNELCEKEGLKPSEVVTALICVVLKKGG